MANSYYNHTSGIPATLTRGVSSTQRSEFDAIVNGFGTVETAMNTKGAITGQAWTGAHNFTGATITVPTQAQGDNSTKAASTAYVFTYFAPLASPALTGIPTAPTASPGTSTTQIATTAFAAAMAFSSALPAQTGNAGKVVTTDGTTASWGLPAAIPIYTALNFGAF